MQFMALWHYLCEKKIDDFFFEHFLPVANCRLRNERMNETSGC